MNPVIDPKALVKTSHINLNHLQTQLRAQSRASAGGMVFQRALTQAQQTGTGGNSTSILGPQTASVSVQSGDTLSGIVRQFMAASGKNVGQTESMRLAQEVARSNNLANANLIYPGQRINLAALQQALNGPAADNQASLGLPKPGSRPLPKCSSKPVAMSLPTPCWTKPWSGRSAKASSPRTKNKR